jgi:hypothetical protein
VKVLYGAPLYRQTWETAKEEAEAMRLFGQQIIDLGGIGRSNALAHCREMMGTDRDWKFVNMAQIARKPPPVKASHRDWRENLPASHPDAPRVAIEAPKKSMEEIMGPVRWAAAQELLL